MKSKKRKKMISTRVVEKAHRIDNPGFESNYARKRAFLHTHGGYGVDYPEKPWK